MLITYLFNSFNENRYSRPWGAKVTFPDGIKPAYDFSGHFDRSENSVLINADEGDIVAFGQKDHKKGYGWKKFYIVGSDAEVTEAEARRHFNAK